MHNKELGPIKNPKGSEAAGLKWVLRIEFFLQTTEVFQIVVVSRKCFEKHCSKRDILGAGIWHIG